MTLKSPTTVIVENVASENPPIDLGQVMSEIRFWLDRHKVQPAEFKTVPMETGGIAVQIRFNTEDEALLFEQNLPVVIPPSRFAGG
jgi:hypothetical protein